MARFAFIRLLPYFLASALSSTFVDPWRAHHEARSARWMPSGQAGQSAPGQKCCHLRVYADTNFGSFLLLHSLADGEAEGAGDGEPGIMIVWPACNLRPSSI